MEMNYIEYSDELLSESSFLDSDIYGPIIFYSPYLMLHEDNEWCWCEPYFYFDFYKDMYVCRHRGLSDF